MAGSAPAGVLWVAALHKSEDDFAPLGTAVVIDDRRVLTSAHVVKDAGRVRDQLWVAFPMCEDPITGRRAATAVRVAAHLMADLAVVELAQPVPGGGPVRAGHRRPGLGEARPGGHPSILHPGTPTHSAAK